MRGETRENLPRFFFVGACQRVALLSFVLGFRKKFVPTSFVLWPVGVGRGARRVNPDTRDGDARHQRTGYVARVTCVGL